MKGQGDSGPHVTSSHAPCSHAPRSHTIVVMGVSGCGKSSFGLALANALHLDFVEGDGLHPAQNIEKMAKGIPLDDEDRWPWLARVSATLAMARDAQNGIVVSCSALKRSYRAHLRQGAGPSLLFVYLEGSPALLQSRMSARGGHFMPATLLASQLATLEDPRGEEGVVTISIDQPISAMVEQALCAISNGRS